MAGPDAAGPVFSVLCPFGGTPREKSRWNSAMEIAQIGQPQPSEGPPPFDAICAQSFVGALPRAMSVVKGDE